MTFAEREPCELAAWDSEFWGVRIGRVLGGRLDPAAVDAWAAAHGVDCLFFLSDDEPGTAAMAEDAGFRLMDVRVELARATSAEGTSARRARDEDVAALRRIARSSKWTTRFYADPRFPDARCDDLYEVWLERSYEGWADVVLVVDARGVAAGFVACHADRAESRGSIGLISVDESARGRGLGQQLVLGAVSWAAREGLERMTVVTQGRNIDAQRLFQRSGFRTESIALWFHKWYR
jgi:dTDP-4-amino-4,6-dideoxy-D-galactose acyltransferase